MELLQTCKQIDVIILGFEIQIIGTILFLCYVYVYAVVAIHLM